MPEYQEHILHQFAESLYKEAFSIVYTTAIKYGVVVFVGTFTVLTMLGQYRSYPINIPPLVPLVGATVLAILFGVKEGQRRAFLLRLQAQQVLVQVEIERNTRKPV